MREGIKSMSLITYKVYHVYCGICDWMHDYTDVRAIPEVCPACGGDKEAFNKIWETRKEEIHKKILLTGVIENEYISSGKK